MGGKTRYNSLIAATFQDKLHVFLFPILPYLNIEPQSTLYIRQMKSAHDLYLTEMIRLSLTNTADLSRDRTNKRTNFSAVIKTERPSIIFDENLLLGKLNKDLLNFQGSKVT